MELKTIAYKHSNLGVRATVAVVNETGQPIYRDEVKLWHGASRQSFIERAIQSANGHLNENQRKELQKQWDIWLMNAETAIKAELQREHLPEQKANAGQTPLLQAEEKEEALKYLSDPDLMTRTQDDLTEMGIVGEHCNKVLVYVVATSRKMRNPLAARGESHSTNFFID